MSESNGESHTFHKRNSNEFDSVNTHLHIILCSKLIIVHKGLLVFRIANICHLPVRVVHNVLFLQEHVPSIYLAWTYLDRKTKMKYVVFDTTSGKHCVKTKFFNNFRLIFRSNDRNAQYVMYLRTARMYVTNNNLVQIV